MQKHLTKNIHAKTHDEKRTMKNEQRKTFMRKPPTKNVHAKTHNEK